MIVQRKQCKLFVLLPQHRVRCLGDLTEQIWSPLLVSVEVETSFPLSTSSVDH